MCVCVHFVCLLRNELYLMHFFLLPLITLLTLLKICKSRYKRTDMSPTLIEKAFSPCLHVEAQGRRSFEEVEGHLRTLRGRKRGRAGGREELKEEGRGRTGEKEGGREAGN